jgi:hypothetical protein
MLPNPNPNQNQNQGQTEPCAFLALVEKTSRKIIAIGASLKVWLRAVERIAFTKEVSHTPDPKLIEELTAVLLATETKKPRLDD